MQKVHFFFYNASAVFEFYGMDQSFDLLISFQDIFNFPLYRVRSVSKIRVKS